jgi:hypothetical protein
MNWTIPAGLWELEGIDSKKSEKAWRLMVSQMGAEVSAAILRAGTQRNQDNH